MISEAVRLINFFEKILHLEFFALQKKSQRGWVNSLPKRKTDNEQTIYFGLIFYARQMLKCDNY